MSDRTRYTVDPIDDGELIGVVDNIGMRLVAECYNEDDARTVAAALELMVEGSAAMQRELF